MDWKRTTKGHHEKPHTHKSDDLDEMNQFRRSDLPKLTPGERIHIEGFILNTLSQGLQSGSSV
jgi:hypothetical protein